MLLHSVACRAARFGARPCVTSAGTTVSIDVSKVPQRTPLPGADNAPLQQHSGLLSSLATQMRVRGPMSIKEFMTVALTHPTYGYYMRHTEVFGRGGDFVTSPEVSQVFGELLGVWCVACWQKLGRPARIRVVEAGPGKGTLMADILRSTAVFDGFHAALDVSLVEVSAHLRAVQRQTLAAAGEEEVAAAAAATGDAGSYDAPLAWRAPSGPVTAGRSGGGSPTVDVRWHVGLESVPSDPHVPELILGHEFLDALPVHQLVKTERGWRERQVDLSEHASAVLSAADAAAAAAAAADKPAGGGASGAIAEGYRDLDSGYRDLDSGYRDLDSDERALEFVLSATETPASLLYGERLGVRLDGADAAASAQHDGGEGGTGASTGRGGGGGGGGGGFSRAQPSAAEVEKAEALAQSSSAGGGSGRPEAVLGALEVCPGALSFMQQVCRRLRASRGAALMIDYGGDAIPTDSLRGIMGHKAVHPLHAPGLVDLSTDVDFGALRGVALEEVAAAPPAAYGRGEEGGGAATALCCPPLASQRDFLAAMGLEPRVNALLRQMEDKQARKQLIESAGRLVASPGMGTAYKVFALASADLGDGDDGVPGLGHAPPL